MKNKKFPLSNPQKSSAFIQSSNIPKKTGDKNGERLAKRIAASGLCSRRDAEKLILQSLVTVDGKIIDSPAFNVSEQNVVCVDGQEINKPVSPRLWCFYKPVGIITSHRDPENRPTLFELLPKNFPRVISVGRLDLNSEGLILLTNSGEMARYAELPSTGWQRCYRVRVYGDINLAALQELRQGITIDGIVYGSIEVDLIRQNGANAWLYVLLREGKNREIRKIMNHFNLRVSRLIRVAYGPFALGELQPNEYHELSYAEFSSYFPFLENKTSVLQATEPFKKNIKVSKESAQKGAVSSERRHKHKDWQQEENFSKTEKKIDKGTKPHAHRRRHP